MSPSRLTSKETGGNGWIEIETTYITRDNRDNGPMFEIQLGFRRLYLDKNRVEEETKLATAESFYHVLKKRSDRNNKISVSHSSAYITHHKKFKKLDVHVFHQEFAFCQGLHIEERVRSHTTKYHPEW
jgi:hypothetical protein